jgi:hypothetical protein
MGVAAAAVDGVARRVLATWRVSAVRVRRTATCPAAGGAPVRMGGGAAIHRRHLAAPTTDTIRRRPLRLVSISF